METVRPPTRFLINVGNGAGKPPASAASLKSVPGKSLFLNARATSRHSPRGCLTITNARTMANCPRAEAKSQARAGDGFFDP